MNIKDCYIGQKVGLSHEGEVITGVVANIDGNVIDVDSKDYEDLQVNVKRLLGVVQ